MSLATVSCCYLFTHANVAVGLQLTMKPMTDSKAMLRLFRKKSNRDVSCQNEAHILGRAGSLPK
jgi:hypothetical protein